MSRVLVLDTSILCVWLQVHGKERCGGADDPWDYQRVDALLRAEQHQRSTFVLPLATIIETGNHIAQAPQRRRETARKLVDILLKTLNQEEPWAAFEQQELLWRADALKNWAPDWPDQANQGLSMGDATITRVMDYYAQTGMEVEIITGDRQLKAYQPSRPTRTPRRRR